MNLIETRNNLEAVYTVKLFEAYQSAAERAELGDKYAYWPVESMCHDYLQLGGVVNDDSIFNDAIARTPDAETNDYLHPNERLTFVEAAVRNDNLTLDEIRQCIALNTNLTIEMLASYKVNTMVKVLTEFVQCGGVLEELDQESEKYKKSIASIENSPFSDLLAIIQNASAQNALERSKEAEVTEQFNK